MLSRRKCQINLHSSQNPLLIYGHNQQIQNKYSIYGKKDVLFPFHLAKEYLKKGIDKRKRAEYNLSVLSAGQPVALTE